MTTLADAVADFLYEAGARQIFAISGASDLRLLDAVARHEGLDYICPHHEQAGVMAASMLGRVSGRLGVMMVTAGPGATNAVTGIASAHLDSLPLLAIGGQEASRFLQPPNGLRGKGVQGLDMVSVLTPLTKYAVSLVDAHQARYELEKAVHLAHEGRPGPVWVEIPQDLQTVEVDWATLPGYEPPPTPAPSDELVAAVDRFIELVRGSSRPLLWAGHGIRLAGAVDEFREMVELLGTPSLVTWNGLDLLPDDHRLNAGRAGIYGQRAGNFALQNCDLVFGLGTRMAIPQVGYALDELAREATRGLVEIDPDEAAKFTDVFDLVVQADVAAFIGLVLDRVRSTPAGADAYADWVGRVHEWRRRYPAYGTEHQESVPDRVNSYLFVDRLSDALSGTDTICTDMGTSLTCTHATLRVKEGQRVVTSTGLGEMGFGLPGAIGACFGADRGRTIFIGAEGSLMMNIQELQTVAHHQLPIKIFILNNNGYLTIRHTERALFGDRALAACGPDSGVSFPDLEQVAKAFGLPHRRLHQEGDLDAFIADVLEQPGPVFAEVMMPEEQFLGPKSAVKVRADGSLYSPPLEDLAPFLPREEVAENMLIPMLPEE